MESCEIPVKIRVPCKIIIIPPVVVVNTKKIFMRNEAIYTTCAPEGELKNKCLLIRRAINFKREVAAVLQLCMFLHSLVE